MLFWVFDGMVTNAYFVPQDMPQMSTIVGMKSDLRSLSPTTLPTKAAFEFVLRALKIRSRIYSSQRRLKRVIELGSMFSGMRASAWCSGAECSRGVKVSGGSVVMGAFFGASFCLLGAGGLWEGSTRGFRAGLAGCVVFGSMMARSEANFVCSS